MLITTAHEGQGKGRRWQHSAKPSPVEAHGVQGGTGVRTTWAAGEAPPTQKKGSSLERRHFNARTRVRFRKSPASTARHLTGGCLHGHAPGERTETGVLLANVTPTNGIKIKEKGKEERLGLTEKQ